MNAPWADIVPCPTCGAPAGVRCPGRRRMHPARAQAARDAR